MPKPKPKKMTPREARTLNRVFKLSCNSVSIDEYWMMVDLAEVTITKQYPGCEPQAMAAIPRAIFDAFVDWYNTGKYKKPRKKKGAK